MFPPAVGGGELPAEFLEYHVYLDPPRSEPARGRAGDGSVCGGVEALAQCHALRAAFLAEAEPRLRRHVWEREPFELWVWDPAEPVRSRARAEAKKSCVSSEPHLWGRIDVGDAVNDEWLVVGELLRFTAEHDDISVTVRSSDGELLLVEAACSSRPPRSCRGDCSRQQE